MSEFSFDLSILNSPSSQGNQKLNESDLSYIENYLKIAACPDSASLINTKSASKSESCELNLSGLSSLLAYQTPKKYSQSSIAKFLNDISSGQLYQISEIDDEFGLNNEETEVHKIKENSRNSKIQLDFDSLDLEGIDELLDKENKSRLNTENKEISASKVDSLFDISFDFQTPVKSIIAVQSIKSNIKSISLFQTPQSALSLGLSEIDFDALFESNPILANNSKGQVPLDSTNNNQESSKPISQISLETNIFLQPSNLSTPKKYIFALENHCKMKKKQNKEINKFVASPKKQSQISKFFPTALHSNLTNSQIKLKQEKPQKDEQILISSDITLENLLSHYQKVGCSIPKTTSGFSPKTEIDTSAATKWLYLTSKKFRFYQFNIVETSLFHNTLVCLPTGLGKTFIAANVMINYYKWFPKGKIFFLAPTRPLVTQQIATLNCLSTVNEDDIIELTGKIQAEKRKKLYQEKRILFCTPQTMQNDLEESRIDIKEIVLIVIDEAHRATGNYAYANIIRLMEKSNVGYRILALSATPGNTLEDIQQVIDNLCIAKIEVRSDEDQDVRSYVHYKEIIPVIINFSPDIQKRLDSLLKDSFDKLIQWKCVPSFHLNTIVSGCYNKRQYMDIQSHLKNFKGLLINKIGLENISHCYNQLKLISSFLNARKIISEQGIHSFQNFIVDFVNEEASIANKSFHAEKAKLISSKDFIELQVASKELAETHPKQIRLKLLLHDFFATNLSSKCMVFTHNRSSASEIVDTLNKGSLVKAALFVGQSSNSSTAKMTQKDQLKVISDFKTDVFNVLVATCIGEEGLDIGEVDLIVCYDSGFTPIRMLQRIGRTGRQRNGKVYVMLMEGKEAESYKAAVSRSKRIHETLKAAAGISCKGKRAGSKVICPLRFFSFNPRMIPEDIIPTLELDDGKEDYEEKIKNEIDFELEIEGQIRTKNRIKNDDENATKKTKFSANSSNENQNQDFEKIN